MRSMQIQLRSLKRVSLFSLASLAALLITGCACQKCCAPPPVKPPKTTAQILMEVDTAFAAQGRTNLVGAFLNYAAPDAISLPMGQSPIHGREAIAESMLSLAKGELLW